MSETDGIESAVRAEAAAPVDRRTRTWARDAGPFRLAGGLAGRVITWIGVTFEREIDRGRGFLWLPVVFGAGILTYFVLPTEPNIPALVGLLAVCAFLTWIRRHSATGFRILVVATAIAAGLVAAKVRTDWVTAPVISREMTVTVAGWIAAAEESARGGKRVRLRVASIEGLSPADTPINVRVTIRSGATNLSVGDAISVLASLNPPSGPVMPGGYDFAFTPFYERIGAIGFAFGAAKPLDLGPPPLKIRLIQPLAHLRDAIRVRIEQALPGDYGHIAAALVMGDQRGIAATTQNDMRASGLGHILSISGLHLALVAGSVFWLIRALLALSPALALNYPIKKWAAGAALGAATFYTGISGAEVATVRSWVMLAIMLSAILIDRRALTLRNVALAALVILVFSPESLLSISFQMSFAATVALISTYEVISGRADKALTLVGARERTFLGRAREAIFTLFLTSLVAGLATAPFGAFYFQRIAPLTIVANMAAAPAIGFVVMPMALAAMVAMPLGLEAVPLTVMQWGLAWMVTVAERTAAWSAGLGGVSALPASALLLMVAGFLWLALWRERWRLAGIVPIVLALPIALLVARPDILIDEGATAVAVRGDNGRFSILGGKGADFDVENWLRADADIRPADAADLARGVACDAGGCVGRLADGAIVALTNRRDAFSDDCRMAGIVVSHFDAPPGCGSHALVVDRPALDRFGAHAVYVESSGYRVETAYPDVRRPFMPPVRD